MEPLIIKSLCKSFSRGKITTSILQDVSFIAEKGEFVAVMGPSGSGKSTLLHLIAGLIDADSGEILLEGQDVTKMNDAKLTVLRRQKIGFVFQSFNLVPSLNVYDNIVLPVLADGKQVDKDGLNKLLERLKIEDKKNSYPLQLSGGEQQRVAIARALLQKPGIILADEPTGSLDTIAGQELCRLLREICDEYQCTILMVTHEPSVAVWANRILVLMDGKFADEIKSPGLEEAHVLAAKYQSILENHIKTV